ncbi:von Willebrand factor C and EGF domain-containing protein [Protopterus annectens]|uniref:von Willebrand factor C and EGF domain-containing protein n=1 Tax=Protopterus annectens TaxID=7888 RepID=UPI001CFA8EBC|nr:von Willebrand factor C and EGF domain-containing protein [Protopterus annectens]
MFLLKVLLLGFFLLRSDGRVYSGKKKGTQRLYIPPTQRHRMGPHVCHSGYGSGCCPGWAPSVNSGLCIIPVCSYSCGNGFCIGPNLCSCRDGQQAVTCTDQNPAFHFLPETGLHHLHSEGPPLSCLTAPCEHNCMLIGGIPVCSCYAGYFLSKDHYSCYDVDECSRFGGSGLCQQVCKNSLGSYRCQCYHGFQLSANGRSCVSSKYSPGQAGVANYCGEYGCDLSCNHGGCEHIARVCPVGFTMLETSNGITCKDIDECSTASCNGYCVNTEGGFVCECGAGMQLSSDKHTCVDINECSGNRSPCHQRCKNTVGSYKCSCGPGFYLHSNGHSCRDINECRLDSPVCGYRCKNLIGSYHCICPTGYQLASDGYSCEDVNECASGENDCQHICHNTIGSFVCLCPKGLQLSLDDKSCTGLPEYIMVPAANFKSIQSADFAPTARLLTQAELTSTSLLTFAALHPPAFLAPAVAESDTTSPTVPASVSVPQPVSASDTPEAYPTTQGSPVTVTSSSTEIPSPPLRSTALITVTSTSLASDQDTATDSTSSMNFTTTLPMSTLPSSMCWYEGGRYLTGQEWRTPRCMDCKCQEGEVLCHNLTCDTFCTHPVPQPEACCPTCNRCFYDGTIFSDEEVFSPDANNCTVCICIMGNITCLSPECPPVTCETPIPSDCCPQCPEDCIFLGNIYADKVKFTRPDDPCSVCVCQDGEVECSIIRCPELSCPREEWKLEPGKCCFACMTKTTATGCSVDDNGIEFPVGQIWSPGDPCEICICQVDGSIACERTDCIEICQNPIQIPGQCCPDCSAGCAYDGSIYQNNQTFPSASDPCQMCICLLGSVACSPVECNVPCTYPFSSEAECCPSCTDCNYEGRKVINGQSFHPEHSSCTNCTCQFGEVSCEPVICPFTCSHPLVPPGECCPTCKECLYEDQILEDGMHIVSDSDPCVICYCGAGSVECKWVGDSCPDLTCEQPLLQHHGHCCPICPDETLSTSDASNSSVSEDNTSKDELIIKYAQNSRKEITFLKRREATFLKPSSKSDPPSHASASIVHVNMTSEIPAAHGDTKAYIYNMERPTAKALFPLLDTTTNNHYSAQKDAGVHIPSSEFSSSKMKAKHDMGLCNTPEESASQKHVQIENNSPANENTAETPVVIKSKNGLPLSSGQRSNIFSSLNQLISTDLSLFSFKRKTIGHPSVSPRNNTTVQDRTINNEFTSEGNAKVPLLTTQEQTTKPVQSKEQYVEIQYADVIMPKMTSQKGTPTPLLNDCHLLPFLMRKTKTLCKTQETKPLDTVRPGITTDQTTKNMIKEIKYSAERTTMALATHMTRSSQVKPVTPSQNVLR